jgi:ABC-2 type transport system ATP-binding protein
MSVLVAVADPPRAAHILGTAGFTVAPGPEDRIAVGGAQARDFDPAIITRLLADQQLYVRELTPVRADLESVFLQLTAEEHLGATQHPGWPSPGQPPTPPPPAGGQP